jgi:glucose-6-phosphate isomerase/transaldolase/glucose-6-phosphate isomerase
VLTARAVESLARADAAGIVRRLWQKDFTIWRDDPTEISNRLGWLTVVDTMRPRASEIQGAAAALRDSGITDVVLLGMGGSSLAPEVFRRTFGSAPGFPALHVLDTTSPNWIRRVTSGLDAKKLHVLLASKSGSTIEVRTLFAHFEGFLRAAGIERIGDHFSAITDPGTALDALSRQREFRHAFLNPADIGGRYSALSLFGLVPAAMIGLPVHEMLDAAAAMMERCREESPRNPGLQLGVFLGASAREGRDKLTMLTSHGLSSFGLWIEQLVAESTGKDGTGIVPVAEEPYAPVDRLGSDRVFVATRCADEGDATLDARIRELEAAGQPVYVIDVPSAQALPAEMFRWELATAVAGHVLGIHPFDQPDVQAAKSQATKILDSLAAGNAPPAVETRDAQELLGLVVTGDYVGFMVYGDPSDELLASIDELRAAVTKRFGVATTLGIGPRFLHSTGQLHKGGAPNGVFPQIVLAEEDLAIPGEAFGFRQLMEAQAGGDLAALRASGRRAARVDLADASAVRALARSLA